MPIFERVPSRVEAVRYDGTDKGKRTLAEFAGHWVSVWGRDVYVTTPRGAVGVSPGDWLIKGGPADFYPCPDELFSHIYRPIEPAGD